MQVESGSAVLHVHLPRRQTKKQYEKFSMVRAARLEETGKKENSSSRTVRISGRFVQEEKRKERVGRMDWRD